MTETTIQNILPRMIIFDAGTQARTKTDIKTCEAYIESMKDGAEFPPLEVFSDGTSDSYILADGFHRLQSHMSFRPNEPIPCRVHFGAIEDAQWFAITANKTHGLRRTNEDKRKAVKMALVHPQGAEKSTRQLSEEIGVSHQTVHNIRTELVSTVKSLQSTRRIGKDGRVIDTANIGQKNRYPHLNEPPEPESTIRTNADGKQINIKSFDFTAKRRCEDCDNWDPATGLCECDDSPQPSWTPGCDDWLKREINPEEGEIEVVRLRTNKRQETTRTNTEKSHYVREEHITCKIYTQNPQLTVVELRTLLGDGYLLRLQKAIESMCKEDSFGGKKSEPRHNGCLLRRKMQMRCHEVDHAQHREITAVKRHASGETGDPPDSSFFTANPITDNKTNHKNMLKYIILNNESKAMPDETLVYRIEAVRDFGNVRKGDKGGFVRDGENLSHHGNCWVADDAVAADFSLVQGDAVLSGKAKLLRFAWIAGNAHVTDRVLMTDYTSACGNAFLGGFARLCEGASVFENGHIKTAWRRGWTMRGLTTVRGNARLIDKAFMQDRSLLDGDAVLRKLASLRENARACGHADIGGSSRISGDAWLTGWVAIRDRSQVTGDVIIHGRVVICGKSYVTGKVRICGNQHYKNVILGGDQILN